MMKKTGGQHLNQVIKVSITNNGTSWHHMSPEMMHRGHKIIYVYVIFLPKMHNLNLI